MRKLAVPLFIVLFLLHHDFWLWADKTLVLGFVPSGLAYHAAFSIASGLYWAFVMKFAWPDAVERLASGPDAAEERSA